MLGIERYIIEQQSEIRDQARVNGLLASLRAGGYSAHACSRLAHVSFSTLEYPLVKRGNARRLMNAINF